MVSGEKGRNKKLKAYSKTLFRMLRQHLGRFLAVTAIIALGIGFMTGLGSVKPKLIGTLDKYYSDRAVPDLILKSTAGFSQAQIDAPQRPLRRFFFLCPLRLWTLKRTAKRCAYSICRLSELNLNRLELVEGKFPSTAAEMVVEREKQIFRRLSCGRHGVPIWAGILPSAALW